MPGSLRSINSIEYWDYSLTFHQRPIRLAVLLLRVGLDEGLRVGREVQAHQAGREALDEGAPLGVVGEVFGAKKRLADQLGFAVSLLFPVESVVFDIVAQLMIFEINVILFTAITCIGANVFGQAASLEVFSLGQAEAEARLGEEGWRSLDAAGFDALLRGIEALDLSS